MQKQKDLLYTQEIPPVFSDYAQVICTILSIPSESITGVSPLGGMTNLNFRLDAGGKSYAVRLAGEWAQEMIERKAEHICTALAEQVGIHTDLLYFDPRTGLKICGFIPQAEPMCPESFGQPLHMAMAARLLNRLHHCGEAIPVHFDFSGKVELYEKLLQRHSSALFADYAHTRRRVFDLMQQAKAMNSTEVPCHNDPVPENFIKSGADTMYLLDWEYGGMNDPMWDLAALSVECGWDASQDKAFLQLYLRREATSTEYTRFCIYKIFPDFLWSLWGKLRAATGGDGSGFDYQAYGQMRYDRALYNLHLLPAQQ